MPFKSERASHSLPAVKRVANNRMANGFGGGLLSDASGRFSDKLPRELAIPVGHSVSNIKPFQNLVFSYRFPQFSFGANRRQFFPKIVLAPAYRQIYRAFIRF